MGRGFENREQSKLDAVSHKTRLLIIDDDTKFCRLISDYLTGFGYEVQSAHNGEDGLRRALNESWQAVILDVMIPVMDGFAVLKQLRERSGMPVLMLTALGDDADKIVGLELGADDYVPKTSSPRELLARLRALIRRASYPIPEAMQVETDELPIGPLIINTAARFATLNGIELQLTPVEFDLLVVLGQSKNRVKSREELLNEIRDRNYDVFDRSIDVHVSALRKKLGDDPKSPRFIRTVRGAGYMLAMKQE
jgi:DNA-binding response OmpR family regulator